MRAHAIRLSFPTLTGLLLVSVSCLAHGGSIWVEKMECGQVHYQLESECQKSTEPLTLNDCKWQRLTTNYKDKASTVTLPQLDRVTTTGIKETGGEILEMFVTRWGCVSTDKGNVALLYYSVGGGSAPYADAYMVYDTEGKFIDDDDNPMVTTALAKRDKGMRRVKSIMPD